MQTKFNSPISDEKVIERLSLGVTDAKTVMTELLGIHKVAFQSSSKYAHKKFFKEHINNGDIMTPTHPLLAEFIGAYTIASVDIPEWFGNFINQYIMWVCDALEKNDPQIYEEIAPYKPGDVLSKRAMKIIDSVVALKSVTPESFDAGKLNDGRKIIKSLLSAVEVGVGRKDLNPEESDWYRLYVANKLEGGGSNITITNSKVAKLCTSSLFSGHSATSCQRISDSIGDSGHADGIYCNVTDDRMLVMFEEGAPINIYCNGKGEEFTSMKWRTILRLVEFTKEAYKCKCGMMSTEEKFLCPNCSDMSKREIIKQNTPSLPYGIMFDAFYPNANYLLHAYTIVKEIADKIGIPVIISTRAHFTQSGSTSKYKPVKGEVIYFGSYGEKVVMDSCEDCSGCKQVLTMSTCDQCKPISTAVCKACKGSKAVTIAEHKKCKACYYYERCTFTDCNGCPYTRCKTYQVRSGYNDQMGGAQFGVLHANKTTEMMQNFCEVKEIIKC